MSNSLSSSDFHVKMANITKDEVMSQQGDFDLDFPEHTSTEESTSRQHDSELSIIG